MPHAVAAALALAFACPAPAAPVISPNPRRQADAFYRSAYSAYVAGDLNHALTLLDSGEAIKPDHADCLNLRGIICLRQNAYDRAEAAFARAVALDASLWAAQFNLGEIPFRKKDFATARARFEKLLSHTSRFKQRNQWELVQYKTYLCCLLTGDDAAAQKNLERIPADGGVTPAYQYAQAALALSKKDGSGAAKWITIAQGSFPPPLNNLFSDALATAGWANALPAGAALALNRQLPGNVDLRRERSNAVYIDPRLEAAAAEPLPAADGGILPMLPPEIAPGKRPAFSLMPERTSPPPAKAEDTLPPIPAPTPAQPVSGLDNGGLLQRD